MSADTTPGPQPGDVAKLVLRIFGGLFILLGVLTATSLIGLLRGTHDNWGGAVFGLVMLGIGIGLLRLQGWASRRLNDWTAAVRERDGRDMDVFEDRVQVGGRVVRHSHYRTKSVDAEGRPVDSPRVRKLWRLDEQDRFVSARERTPALMVIGLLLLAAAAFLFDLHKVLLGSGGWDTDPFNFALVLLGLLFFVAGGMRSELIIDRRGGRVLQHRSLLGFSFDKDRPLAHFDHLRIRRHVSSRSSQEGGRSRRSTEIRYGVELAGDELIPVARFDSPFDAQALARRISEYTGFAVKEDL